MALYQVMFFDHGDNVRIVHHVEADNDDLAIEAAHQMNVLPHFGSGFDVWEGDRLVHRHRN